MSQPVTDFPQVASQWLRALRGKRSQVALSRRLGYRTNVAYRWEAGQCFPTAARTFELIAKLGTDLDASLERFVHLEGPTRESPALSSRQGVANLLSALNGRAPVTALAAPTAR